MKAIALTLVLAGLLSAPLWAATPSANTYKVTQHYVLGGSGGWDYLTLDPALHHLFIARDNRVMVVDTVNGNVLKEIPGMQHAHGVALVPDAHRAYVSNGHGNNVSVVDLDTLDVIGHIPVSGKDPDAIIYDSASGHVLAMNGHSNSISVIDPRRAKEIASIAVPGNPEFAVSDGRGSVYLNLEDKGELVRVDSHANTVKNVWSLTPCAGPTGLAFDAASARLFSVCANGWMIVTDAHDGHQVAKLAIGKDPDAVAYDAQRHTVLSSSGEGTLNVIHQDDADHYSVVANMPTRKGARTLALDPKTHQVFLVAGQSAGRGKPVTDFSMLVVGSP
jgi:YVTN family beta-propeller protein